MHLTVWCWFIGFRTRKKAHTHSFVWLRDSQCEWRFVRLLHFKWHFFSNSIIICVKRIFFFRENKIPFLIRIYSSTLFNWLNWNSLLCSNTLTTYKICIYAFLHGVAWQPPQLTVHQNVRDGRTYSYDRMCAWHDCVCVWVSVLALGMCSHSIAILVFLSTGRVVSFSLCFYAVRMRVVFTLRKPAVDFYRFILFTCFQQSKCNVRIGTRPLITLTWL